MKSYHFRKTIDLEILAKNKKVMTKVMRIINKKISKEKLSIYLDSLIDEIDKNEELYCEEFDDDLDFGGWSVWEDDWKEV